MKISLSWMHDYFSWGISPEELAHRLTMTGLEVESIEYLGKQFDGFVVGEVLGIQKHPKAEKLTVCEVSTGKGDPLQIVCGAPNVDAGQKVAIGLIGATVPHDQHDPEGKPFILTKVKIRGVESSGMICSEFELGVGNDANGILVLSKNAVPGTPLADYFGLNDIVFEIGVTPNRPDCLSHIGVAREVAAIFDAKMERPVPVLKESDTQTDKVAKIVIEDPAACPRYTARVLQNVTIQESPKWLQRRLKSVGLRPINNVVDVTNYVLMETGHPLHAFDYDLLAKHTIIVRSAQAEEKFRTLDGKERTLRTDTLMICDGEKPVAVAGVMGGLNSEISWNTKNVLLESAYFSPVSIRRTSKYLGLNTDASHRFERGADPEITQYAVDRAAVLIQETGGGEICKGVIDVYPQEIDPPIVPIRIERTNALLGTTLTESMISELLKKIEFKIDKKEGDTLRIRVPTFRPDVEREADLIEEVARVYGYDNIPEQTVSSVDFASFQISTDLTDILRDWLVGGGFNEIVTNSMQDPKFARLGNEAIVEIKNPLGVEMSVMRTSLIPGILQTIRHNQFHGNENLRIFEIGHVFHQSDVSDPRILVGNIIEEERVAIALVGNVHLDTWNEPARSADIYDVKGEVETLFKKISLDKHRFISYSTEKTLSESCITVEISNTYAGFIGVIRDDVAKMFDVEGSVFVAELNLDLLKQHRNPHHKYHPVPKFPVIRRDLAFVVDRKVQVEDMINQIKTSGGLMLRQVRLFDVFDDDRFGVGNKSIAFRLEFLSEERTLTDKEIDASVEKIVTDFARVFNAGLRSA
jgi:phenylalanyl-tRNA synthetase beta chain